ncbi:TolC family protein [Mucilaginibacter flavus]|uniref:TolC family protein n=1 Tax=Mucilaginibacter flavus TaxID=931504 RepID=UPI0025B48CCB|nr:TolC family protein [Mucilaginibacter flavus]MDN3584568.1 TolC family protein [Mucilaginibacter flavus]
MNKRIFFTICILIAFAFQQSKAQDSTRMSLQSAIENAIRYRVEIKIQQVNAANSFNEVSKANSKLLPQLTSDLDLRYNSQLQTNILPGTVFGQAGTPDKKVKFGTNYNTVAAINLVIPIYTPADQSDKQIAKIQAEYDGLNVLKTQEDIKEEVTVSYFNGLIAKEKVDLSKVNMDNTSAVYSVGQAQLEKGAITVYELDKSRIDFENARSTYVKDVNTYKLALTDLSYRIGTDSPKYIILSDDLSSLYNKYYDVIDKEFQLNRVELKMQSVQEQIYRQQILKQTKEYIPVVSFYGNYTAQNLNNNFSPFNSNTWYPYNYIGIKASIPLFDGLLKQRSKAGYRLQLESAQLTSEKLKKDYNQDVSAAKSALINDQQDLLNQKNNLKLASELYKVDSGRFNKGTIRGTDLAATYYTLQQTQTNYLNAIYTYLIDVVHYKKALGQL